MATQAIRAPNVHELLGPLLPALPPAALSTEPAEAALTLLSPILRQRVQLLCSSSNEPWIRLLCYDQAKCPRLAEIALSENLQPHPVSGEVEVDWDYDADIRYRRLDEETLQALVVLKDLELAFRLVFCTGDTAEGGDGWKVGEVSVADKPSPFSSFGGVSTIEEADRQFKNSQTKKPSPIKTDGVPTKAQVLVNGEEEEDEDDDDYWARYDATPARTPANKQSPVPQSSRAPASAEDEYFAQYDSVQPAMDNHDPDEVVEGLDAHPPLGFGQRPANPRHGLDREEEVEVNETNGAWTLADPPRSGSRGDEDSAIAHPRPESSASSNDSVAKLEVVAAKQEASEFGVKQHVSRSIKSLFLLSRASGIDREEFERMVRTELDLLDMMED